MFKKSQPSQGDLFKSISNHVSSRKRKSLEDPNSWHNVFYDQVTRRIDEGIFRVLYSEGIGRPNAPVRVLIAMMILKEGHGWSDEQLFEQCRFNLKVMRALGFQNLDEEVPTESTYYEFRRALAHHAKTHREDLMKACFQKITAKQIALHGVKGGKVRLDSKLLNSNIAQSTRLELILEGIRFFIHPLELEPLRPRMKPRHFDLLERLQSQSVANVVYRLAADKQPDLLISLGYIIRLLLRFYKRKKVDNYALLRRLYEEHYQSNRQEDDQQDEGQDRDQPRPRDSSQITSASLQSVHDPEAAFRRKGHGKQKKMVSGYHANITETCSEDNELNLIVDAQVKPANYNESDFLVPSLQAAEQVLSSAGSRDSQSSKCIRHVSTDGGYDNRENRRILSGPEAPHWNRGKPKGRMPVYQFSYDEQGRLQARHRPSGRPCRVVRAKHVDKWVIKCQGHHDRYLSDDEIDSYLLSQRIQENQRAEDKTIRANVEATIHQVFHRLQKRDKMKYRGLYACQCYVLTRVLWANFRRICRKTAETGQYFELLVLWSITMVIRSRKVLIPANR